MKKFYVKSLSLTFLGSVLVLGGCLKKSSLKLQDDAANACAQLAQPGVLVYSTLQECAALHGQSNCNATVAEGPAGSAVCYSRITGTGSPTPTASASPTASSGPGTTSSSSSPGTTSSSSNPGTVSTFR